MRYINYYFQILKQWNLKLTEVQNHAQCAQSLAVTKLPMSSLSCISVLFKKKLLNNILDDLMFFIDEKPWRQMPNISIYHVCMQIYRNFVLFPPINIIHMNRMCPPPKMIC